MILIPAIDLMNGCCVRLKQGDLDNNITIYNDDPADQAERWVARGAERIHIVDLDGAKSGEPSYVEADSIEAHSLELLAHLDVLVNCMYGALSI